MDDLSFNLWLGFGLFCVISEFILPGLVMVFVGLGALSVALGMHLGYIDGPLQQFIGFFVASVFYLVTLRFIILKFVPTDTRTANIDEDEIEIGAIVKVIEKISKDSVGRVHHEDSSWKARTNEDVILSEGDSAKIIGRENITLIVEKL